jgi:hypothetical protein
MWTFEAVNKKWLFVMTLPIDSEMYRFLCNFVLPEYSTARWLVYFSTQLSKIARGRERGNCETRRWVPFIQNLRRLTKNLRKRFWNIKVSWIPRAVKWAFIYFEKLPFHFHFMCRLRVFPSFLLHRSCCFYTVVCRQWQFALWWKDSKWNVSFCCHAMQLPTSLGLKFSACLFTYS